MSTTYEVQIEGGLTVMVENAEYYKHEGGWVTFKDSDHKVIADFPEDRIMLIARREVEAFSVGDVPDYLSDGIAKADEASKRSFYGPNRG